MNISVEAIVSLKLHFKIFKIKAQASLLGIEMYNYCLFLILNVPKNFYIPSAFLRKAPQYMLLRTLILPLSRQSLYLYTRDCKSYYEIPY